MASAKLRRKAPSDDKFLSPDRTRTIKPADFRNHKQVYITMNYNLSKI